MIHLAIALASPIDCFCADFCFACVAPAGYSLSVEAWYTFGSSSTISPGLACVITLISSSASSRNSSLVLTCSGLRLNSSSN